MSHCVFNAYTEHLAYLGLASDEIDWQLYRALKALTHGGRIEAYTDGAAVPFIVQALARRRGLRVLTQHHWLHTPAGYLNQTPPLSWPLRAAVRLADWGVAVKGWDGVWPAIYCSLHWSHAEFGTAQVWGTILAINLQRSDQ